jgi:hypothetical protein
MIKDEQILKIEKKHINGNDYEIRYLPAMKNWQLGIKLSKIIGVSLSDIGGLLRDDDNSAFIKAIYNIVNSLYENDPDSALILEILEYTTRNGVAINSHTFNRIYTGNMHEMLEALIETLKFQFNHFLSQERHSGVQQFITESLVKNMENSTKI